LVFGLVSVAGSQPDQRAPEAGSAKHRVKATQQPQQTPAQDRQKRPAAQNRRQRPADQGRQVQPTPSMSHRQGPAQNPPPSQPPTAQRPRYQAQAGSPQQRPAAAARDRTPLPRQPIQPQTQSRTRVSRVEQQAVWPRYRARSWGSQHRTWVQRGGYNGYRIPGPQFSLYFGRPHRYHLSAFQVRIVGAYPQFYSNGFWFTMLDPVPEYWDNDWYDRDYVTIVETEDGYYLLNDAYPDAQLAISVQLR
jgi:hypothetical protein